ncbi:MAG: hypothetical protein R3D34_02385 [Nitratireductor sp.]
MGRHEGRKWPREIWSLRRAPGKICHHAILLIGSKGNIRALRCVIGRSGISVFKREGDGATPAAQLGLLGGYMARRAWPVRNRELLAITPDKGWCDAPTHSCYNRPVRLPFSASHETLHRPDGLYDICLVLDWNIAPRQRYRGSAIFFHLARHGGEPTEGCIAVSRRHMDLILRRLATNIVIRVIA